MGNRRRARPFREVKSRILARTGANPDITTADLSALVTGLSSLLNLGIHFAFFPDHGEVRPPDGDFAGDVFALYGWTADDRGERAQLDSEAVTGATDLQAPGGWSGSTELDQLEVRATVHAIGTPGTWRLIVVLEPIDGAVCAETFASLCAEVEIEQGSGKPAVVDGAGA